MMARHRTTSVLCATSLLLMVGCANEQSTGDGEASGDMILATTTSTQDSGLLDEILPSFEEASECVPKTVAVGSGQAMTMGEEGDTDVLLVHSPEAEEEFMAEGYGSSREPVMHNDFVLLGPDEDPAGLDAATNAAEAMELIEQEQAPFTSRADDSGTHAKELELWQETGTEPSGSFYIETGQGMGETLTIADQQEAYTLSDRGTFLSMSNIDSEIAFEGSQDLQNPYHVIVLEDEATNVACAQEFSQWLRSDAVQQEIATFGEQEYGEPLFFPDAQD